jgi:Velvet factor
MLGTSVVACERLMDGERLWGYYFIFVDLSFREKGNYRLRFDLYDLAWYRVNVALLLHMICSLHHK